MKKRKPIIEALVKDVESYAEKKGVTPETVVKAGGKVNVVTWRKLVSGDGDLRTRTVDRIREYMREHPLKN